MAEAGISKNVKSQLRTDMVTQRKLIHNTNEPFSKAGFIPFEYMRGG